MEDTVKADSQAPGGQEIAPRISPETVWGESQVEETEAEEPGRPRTEAAAGSTSERDAEPRTNGSPPSRDLRDWYPQVWQTTWRREEDARAARATGRPVQPEPRPAPQASVSETVAPADAPAEDRTYDAGLADSAEEARIPGIEFQPVAEEAEWTPAGDSPSEQDQASPSDDIWADSWVIQPGANGRSHEQIQWSVAEQAVDDDIDPPAAPAFELAEPFDEPEPDEGLDVTFEDLAGSANAAFDPDDAEPQAHRIEDAALEDIFAQGDAFETDAWMPPGDAHHTARDDDHVDLPERWMFQSRRGVRSGRPERTETTPVRSKRRKRGSEPSSEAAIRPEPEAVGDPDPQPKIAKTSGPEAAAPQDVDPGFEQGFGFDFEKGFQPETDPIPDRRRDVSKHRKPRGRRRDRRREAAPQVERSAEPAPEPAGVGGDPSGALVIGRGRASMGSAVRVLAVAVPLTAATLAYLSYAR